MAAENGGVAVAQGQMAALSVGQQPSGALVPVGEARSVLPGPDLSNIKSISSVETQTRAIGIICPPPDIRAIVDKAATFVAKNGACPLPAASTGLLFAQACAMLTAWCYTAGTSFEQRILSQKQNSTKFNFLKPDDPYHAYYRWKASALLQHHTQLLHVA